MGTSIEYNDSIHKTRELINSFYQKCLEIQRNMDLNAGTSSG